ncbi:MAG: beta-propeller domain-containing protein, partial [Porticoccaceae bacterium]
MVDDAIAVGAVDVVADEPLYPIIPEQRSIKIMSTDPANAQVEHVGNIPVEHNHTIEGLYTNGNQLASINSSGWWGMYGDVFMDPTSWRGQTTGVSIYDISNVEEPQLDWNIEIEGGFVT